MRARGRSSARRIGAATTMAVLFTLITAAPAAAAWEAPFDYDDISRSTPSNRAWVYPGQFRWQRQDTSRANYDERASFSLFLKLEGPRNSCAKLRIRTYVGDRWTNSGAHLEKSFPSAGYYSYCQSDGRGSRFFEGADIQDRSIFDIGRFKHARINICWTRYRDVPPGGDCYNFRVRPGD